MIWSGYEHENGVGRFTIEENDREIVVDERPEPTGPEHVGWDASKVLAARSPEEMRRDRDFIRRGRR